MGDVSKSKLPGGGFKPITEFDGKELAGLRRGVTNKRMPYSNSRVQQVHVAPSLPADYRLTGEVASGLKSSKDFRSAQVANMQRRYATGSFKRGEPGPATVAGFRRGRRAGKYQFAKAFRGPGTGAAKRALYGRPKAQKSPGLRSQAALAPRDQNQTALARTHQPSSLGLFLRSADLHAGGKPLSRVTTVTPEQRRLARARYGGVKKSYVNGKFVRATELSAKQAKKIRTTGTKARDWRKLLSSGESGRVREGDPRGQFGRSRGEAGNRRDPVLSTYREKIDHPDTQRLRAAINAGDKYDLDGFAAENNFGAFTHRQGGKSSGVSHVHLNSNAGAMFISPKMGKRHVKMIPAHEQAHADVKRSEYRMHGQIPADTAKHGREEGRADFLAAGHWTGKGHKPNKYGEHPTGYSQAVAAWKKPGLQKEIKTQRKQVKWASGKEGVKHFDRTMEGQRRWNAGYEEVHDKMRAAGTRQRVVKSMDRTMARRRDGRYTGVTIAGFGMTQTDIPLSVEDEDVEKALSPRVKTGLGIGATALTAAGAGAAAYKGNKEAKRLGPKAMKGLSTKEKIFGVHGAAARMAGTERKDLAPVKKAQSDRRWEYEQRVRDQKRIKRGEKPVFPENRPFRDESKGELPYRRSDANQGLGASAALTGLSGSMSGLNAHMARRGTKVGLNLKANKRAAIGYGALAAGGAAATAAFSRDLKRGGTRRHRFTPEVKKGMPDLADVHVQGVLRPIGKIKKKR